MREINNIRNNKIYLKSVYNISFYDKKTQIDFSDIFYEKIFNDNANKNDFIEINFRMIIEYEDISERIYVHSHYEIFDDDNNSLYISSIHNNDYEFFNNKVFINENIFYNFTKNVKDIKLVIKFVMSISKIIKAWYIPNNTHRFILKIMDCKNF